MTDFSFDNPDVAERDQFNLSDDKQIDFVNRDDLTTMQQAEVDRLFKKMEGLNKRMSRKITQDTADAIDEVNRKFIKLILPDIPQEYLESLNGGQMGILAQWWTKQQEKRFDPNYSGE